MATRERFALRVAESFNKARPFLFWAIVITLVVCARSVSV
jgi:hypothetical protein